jgi:2-polyprenyl-6-methoxyphenol hydroxylase-like FAD-dependent oxidoreductase
VSGVLVIGAGIAGLAAAAELRRRGAAVDVVERAPAQRIPTAGIVLHPNALTCLDRLRPALSARGAPIERELAFDADGSRTTVSWPAVWRERSPLAVHRRTLGELLLADAGPETVRWSTTVEHLAQDADGVTVVLADGEARRYDLVVGADGLNSATRGALGDRAAPRFTGHTFVRTTVAHDGPAPFPEWRTWRSAFHHFGAMPIGEGRMAVFLQITGDRPLRLEPAEALALLRRAGGEAAPEARAVAAAIRSDDEVLTRPAFTVAAARPVRGRVVLVGDAAHAVSPATTQGGGLALEDAVVLGDEVARHGCTPAALTAFADRRRQRVASFQRAAGLHVTLMSQVHRAPRPDSRARSAAPLDASPWFRRLYAPLAAAP